MAKHVYVGDYGFTLNFPSSYDLTGMTAVRMLISREAGPDDFYDFAPNEFQGVGVGGTLVYTVRASDLTVPGACSFQPIAKTATLDVAFDPIELEVKRRLRTDAWGN